MSKIIKIVGKNNSLENVLQTKEFSNFSVVKMEQVHDDKFVEISKADLMKSSDHSSKKNNPDNILEIKNIDAVITTLKNLILSVKTADCLPILIYFSNDDKNKTEIIAAIHSGRVGTEKKILKKVLEYLKTKYKIDKLLKKSSTAKLEIWLGPAICKRCYQIDRATDLHYDLYQENLEQIWEFFPESKLAHEFITREPTINSGQIEIIKSKFCTFHDNEKFHSYRKSGKGVSKNYSLIGLK